MDKSVSYQRAIQPALRQIAYSFPIVSITGPRQSGKTTLARQYFPDKFYFNLEDPSQRAEIVADPKGIIASCGKKGAIFDEVHHFPELLSYLQVEVDNQQIKGQLFTLLLLRYVAWYLRAAIIQGCNLRAPRLCHSMLSNKRVNSYIISAK